MSNAASSHLGSDSKQLLSEYYPELPPGAADFHKTWYDDIKAAWSEIKSECDEDDRKLWFHYVSRLVPQKRKDDTDGRSAIKPHDHYIMRAFRKEQHWITFIMARIMYGFEKVWRSKHFVGVKVHWQAKDYGVDLLPSNWSKRRDIEEALRIDQADNSNIRTSTETPRTQATVRPVSATATPTDSGLAILPQKRDGTALTNSAKRSRTEEPLTMINSSVLALSNSTANTDPETPITPDQQQVLEVENGVRASTHNEPDPGNQTQTRTAETSGQVISAHQSDLLGRMPPQVQLHVATQAEVEELGALALQLYTNKAGKLFEKLEHGKIKAELEAEMSKLHTELVSLMDDGVRKNRQLVDELADELAVEKDRGQQLRDRQAKLETENEELRSRLTESKEDLGVLKAENEYHDARLKKLELLIRQTTQSFHAWVDSATQLYPHESRPALV